MPAAIFYVLTDALNICSALMLSLVVIDERLDVDAEIAKVGCLVLGKELVLVWRHDDFLRTPPHELTIMTGTIRCDIRE